MTEQELDDEMARILACIGESINSFNPHFLPNDMCMNHMHSHNMCNNNLELNNELHTFISTYANLKSIKSKKQWESIR